jgi:1-acyl-sn-glycerol-3-phosphate acyltransferase
VLAGVLAIALYFEVRIRIGILPWYRRGTPSWHRIWNRTIRAWGVSTWVLASTGLGLDVEVEGDVPESGRYVVIANHQSSIDILALIYLLPGLDLKFVAHEGLKYGKPGVSLGLRNGGFAFVHKRNRQQDLEELRQFARSTEANQGSPAIFPEGIQSLDGRIRRFQRAGTSAICEVVKLPILPVVHDGLWRARAIDDLPRLVGATIRFRFLEPVPAEALEEDPSAVYADVQRAIRNGLADMRGEPVPARTRARAAESVASG